jgi:hypothetical protein
MSHDASADHKPLALEALEKDEAMTWIVFLIVA